ncbi:MAG: hypothetical protein MPJ78_11480 [Hyphomicrobiaceae bacterium]|nr:hypothetical protein [Hyphomicrobiaceae bacterium]
MASILTRANTVALSFTFKDANGDAANVASASVQLVYSGREALQTEQITLGETAGAWETNWDSSRARGGWVEFHAHAVSSGTPVTRYAEDGRFKLTSNRANLQHDELPPDTNDLKDTG